MRSGWLVDQGWAAGRRVLSVMGYVRCRQSKLRRHRYTAVFWDVWGIERSAGTFARRVLAERAWKSAEASVADGRYLDVDQSRKRLADGG